MFDKHPQPFTMGVPPTHFPFVVEPCQKNKFLEYTTDHEDIEVLSNNGQSPYHFWQHNQSWTGVTVNLWKFKGN